jgi:N-acylneuraminate cytidylyltransferase
MNVLAIITARGGSKRIPQKNIRPFLGKPMLSYPIRAAQESAVFNEIMVSTDSAEIAEIAQSNGAAVPFMRSAETSTDFATTSDVLVEVLNNYQKQGKIFDYFCCIYPCSPFLSPQLLQQAYMMLVESEVDSVAPVCIYPAPVEWAMSIKNGLLVSNSSGKDKLRSQDLEEKYFDVGMFYFCKTASFLEKKKVFSEKTRPIIVPSIACQDIDTFDDWHAAEVKYKIQMDSVFLQKKEKAL